MCVSVPLSASATSTTLSADARVKLNGLAAKLAELGLDGGAKYKKEESQGVLQQHLAAAIKGSNDCRLEVFHVLERDLLHPITKNMSRGPSAPVTPSREKPAGKPAASTNSGPCAGGITSQNQSGGITACVVYRTDPTPLFELSGADIAGILTQIPMGAPVALMVVGSNRADPMAERLWSALEAAGHHVDASRTYQMSPPPDRPISIQVGSPYVVTLDPDVK